MTQNPKAAHYSANLGAALVRGNWSAASPGATPSGSPLSWSELIRKWGKHTRGNTQVVHALRNISLISLPTTNTIPSPVAQVVSAASSGEATISTLSSYVHVPHNAGHARPSFEGGDNNDSIQPTPSSNLPSSSLPGDNFDGPDGSGPGAWAVGAHWGQMLDHQNAGSARQGIATLDQLIDGSQLSPEERLSANLILGYHLVSLGDYDAALSLYDKFDWTVHATAGVVDGDAAIVERIRARTLQGFCCELGSRPDLARALDCYLDAVSLLDRLAPSPFTLPSYLAGPSPPRPASLDFSEQREPLRHASTALTRAAVLTSRGANQALALRIIRTYNVLAAKWSYSSFRSEQRRRMHALYMTTLYGSHSSLGSQPNEQYLLVGGVPTKSPLQTWTTEVLEAFKDGKRLLGGTTAFPNAGETNAAVSQFANQVAAFPTISPSLAGDAKDTLWWATRFTFQSQAILRNLTRLLAASGSTSEARRTFEAYVKLVLKGREALHPDNPLSLKDNPDTQLEDLAQQVAQEEGLGSGSRTPVEDNLDEAEHDSDEEFIGALLVGIRLLLIDLDDSKEAWRYATLAGDVVERGALAQATVAKVEEAKGIVRLLMSTAVASSAQRPAYQQQAVDHLTRATSLSPTSAQAHYHLAYAQAMSREVDAATDSVRVALELDPQDVRAWHLLALLLTAIGDWQGAAKAGQAGIGIWEADNESTDDDEGDRSAGLPQPLLLPDGSLAPLSPQGPCKLDRPRRLDAVIELRMTLNVIAEKLNGPEAALEDQQALFAFFRERSDYLPAPRPRTRSATYRGSIRSAAPTDLGGSYVITPPMVQVLDEATSPTSPTTTNTTSQSTTATTMATVQPLQSLQANRPAVAARPATPLLLTPASTVGSTAASSSTTLDADGQREKTRRRHALSHRKNLLPLQKHLHVPAVARVGRGGEGLRVSSAPNLLAPVRQRTASQSTVALSIAPTAVHSHYRGSSNLSAPPPPPPQERQENCSPQETRILSNLWLMSAASFRRAGKLEQALVAIEEAETRAPENPAVWVQLGMWYLAVSKGKGQDDDENVLAAFTKGLLLKPDYPAALINISRLYLKQGEVDLAHSLLSQLVDDKGWDVPEAWYALATVCERQGRKSKARSCLIYALSLERSRCCRPLRVALDCWL